MKITDTILKGFKVVHANMPLFLLVFVYNVILAILAIIIMGRTPMPAPGTPGAPPVAGAVIMKGLIYNIITLLLWIFVQGGLLNLFKSAVAEEGGKDLGLFLEGGQKYYLPLLVLILIFVVPLGILMGLMTGLGGAITRTASPGLSIIFILLLLVLIADIIFLIFALFAPYEVVVAGKDAISSIKNSLGLVAANFWRTLGLLALLILIGIGVGLLVGIVMGVASVVFKGMGMVVTIITLALSSLINAYVIMIVTASIMAYYLSLTGQKVEASTPKI